MSSLHYCNLLENLGEIYGNVKILFNNCMHDIISVLHTIFSVLNLSINRITEKIWLTCKIFIIKF